MKMKALNFMKHIIVLILLIHTLPTSGQVVAVQNDKQNVLYAGIPNPITVAASKVSSSKIVVTTSNGTIANEGQGRYVLVPERVDPDMVVDVKKKKHKGQKYLDSKHFRVKEIPLYPPYFSGINSGEISKVTVCENGWLKVLTQPEVGCGSLLITQARIVIADKKQTIFSKLIADTNGIRLDKDTDIVTAFSNLNDNDKLIFKDIQVSMSPRSPRPIYDSINLVITGAKEYDLPTKDTVVEVEDPITGSVTREHINVRVKK